MWYTTMNVVDHPSDVLVVIYTDDWDQEQAFLFPDLASAELFKVRCAVFGEAHTIAECCGGHPANEYT